VGDGHATCSGSSEACRAAAHGGRAGIAHHPYGQDGPRLLFFSSAECPACARMKPVLAGVERDCHAGTDIAHVDVDADPGEGLAAAYGVTLLPTLMSVDAAGHEVARLTGVQSAEAIERALEEVRGAKCALLEPRE
jgi:thioredoxin-like negative regulator of GroEL